MPTEDGSAAALAVSTIRVRSPDGAETTCTILAPALPPRAAVLCLPAMGMAARHYAGLARALAAHGLCAVTLDWRGIGSSSLRAARHVDFGYHERVHLDLPAAIAAMREHRPGTPLFLLGHSVGAHVSALHESLHPGSVAGLVFAAAGTSYYRCWPLRGGISLLLFAQLARWIPPLLGYFPGRALGVFGREARTQMREWATLTERGRFAVTGSAVDCERALATVRLPLLSLSFAGDDFAPPNAAAHLLAKLPGAQVTRRTFTAGDLGAPRLDHFAWLDHPAAVAEEIARWIAATHG